MSESSKFDTLAAVYASVRPAYPEEILDAVESLSGVRLAGAAVADVGAGTGIAARQLRDRGARVTALDLSGPMLDELVSGSPGVAAVQASGNALPLRDGSMDLVTFATAWHWVDPDRAIPEVARILRDGGTLALVWNRGDRSVPWVADIEEFRRRSTKTGDIVYTQVSHYLQDEWLPEGSPFVDIEISGLPWSTPISRDELSAMLTTYTGYIQAPPERKPEILREYTEYVNNDPRLGTGDLVEWPMRCHYWKARRTGR